MKKRIELTLITVLFAIILVYVTACKKTEILPPSPEVILVTPTMEDDNNLSLNIRKVIIAANNLTEKRYRIEFTLKGANYEKTKVIYKYHFSKIIDMSDPESHEGSRNTSIFTIKDIAAYDVYYIKLLDAKATAITEEDIW